MRNCPGAKLSVVTSSGAKLSGAKLSGVKLSGVKLSQDLIMVFIICSFDDDTYCHHDNDGYYDHE